MKGNREYHGTRVCPTLDYLEEGQFEQSILSGARFFGGFAASE